MPRATEYRLLSVHERSDSYQTRMIPMFRTRTAMTASRWRSNSTCVHLVSTSSIKRCSIPVQPLQTLSTSAKPSPLSEVRSPKRRIIYSRLPLGTEPESSTYHALLNSAPRQVRAKTDSDKTLPMSENLQINRRRKPKPSWTRSCGKRWRGCLARGVRRASSMRMESPWL